MGLVRLALGRHQRQGRVDQPGLGRGVGFGRDEAGCRPGLPHRQLGLPHVSRGSCSGYYRYRTLYDAVRAACAACLTRLDASPLTQQVPKGLLSRHHWDRGRSRLAHVRGVCKGRPVLEGSLRLVDSSAACEARKIRRRRIHMLQYLAVYESNASSSHQE